MPPLGRMDLARSLLSWPARCARGGFGSVGPLPRTGRHRRRTRLGEILVVRLTKLSALSFFGSPQIGRSDARISSVASFASLVLAHRVVRCNYRQRLAAARMQVLEVSFEILREMVGRPT